MNKLVRLARELQGTTIVGTAGGGSLNVIAGELARQSGATFEEAHRLLGLMVDAWEVGYQSPSPGDSIEQQWEDIYLSTDEAIRRIRRRRR